jgi:hypothetical protein
VENDFRESSCASGAVERLVHKLGNHLTLPQMIGNALKQDFPACREIDVLDETLGRTIDLTRSFSDFIQTPAQTFEPLDFLEILDRIPTTRDLLLSRIFERAVNSADLSPFAAKRWRISPPKRLSVMDCFKTRRCNCWRSGLLRSSIHPDFKFTECPSELHARITMLR